MIFLKLLHATIQDGRHLFVREIKCRSGIKKEENWAIFRSEALKVVK